MKKHNLILLFLVILFILTGCWDRMEIEERSTVLGMSVDLAEDDSKEDPINHPDDVEIPSSKVGMIEVTAQLAVPGQIPLGPAQGGGAKGPQDSVWVVKAVGHTIADAVNNLQQQLASTIFLGHLKIIIISKEVAQIGLGDIMDFLKRHPEVRRDAWLLVNGKKAAETLEVAPKLERIPAIYLSNMLDNAIKMGKFPKVKLGRFWVDLECEGKDAYLPFITVKTMENIQISGIAYFQADKMVGHTKPYQIAYLNALKEQNPGGAQAMVKLSNDEAVMVQSTHRKSKYKVTLVNGKPHFKVLVEVDGKIVGRNRSSIILDDRAALKRIEKTTEDLLEEQVKKLIKETQEKQSDILGFGEYVRGDLRTYWDNEIKTVEKWREVYKELSIDVQTKVNIEGIGLRAK